MGNSIVELGGLRSEADMSDWHGSYYETGHLLFVIVVEISVYYPQSKDVTWTLLDVLLISIAISVKTGVEVD